MASTNKTTNYELSQYVGTDKPTYLGDYNSDMGKIDTAIHGVAQSVGTEQGRINVVENNIGTMANLQTTDKTSLVDAINEVNTKSNNNATNIGSLASLTTQNKTTIVNAVNELESDIEKFNLTNFKTYTQNTASTDLTKTNVNLGETQFIVASNSDGSIFKVYGYSVYNAITAGSVTSITLKNTGIVPTEAFSINNMGIDIEYTSNNTIAEIYGVGCSVASNGDVTIALIETGRKGKAMINPCLYFAKNFGDVNP